MLSGNKGEAFAIMSENKALLTRFFDGKLLPGSLFDAMTRDQGWFPHRVLKCGPVERPLPPLPGGLPDLEIRDKGRVFDLYDFITTNCVEGLVILKDGQVAFETYQHGLTPETLWHSCSVAKSFSSTMVGVALKEGAIASLDDAVSKYADLGGCYRHVTVRQLLRMTSGVRWSEDYSDPASERRQLLNIQRAWRKGGILAFMQNLPAEAEPGQRWAYNTGESYLLGAVLEGATGMNLADYMSDRLWSKIGMSQDGRWWVESPDGGMTIAGSGMNACLRDYARFGQFMLENGSVDGRSLLPEGWRDEACAPFSLGEQEVPYGYMWWIPELPDPILEGSFQAEGIY